MYVRRPRASMWTLLALLCLWAAQVGCEPRADQETPARSGATAVDAGPPPADVARRPSALDAAATEDASSDAGADATRLVDPRPPLLWIVEGAGGPLYLFGTMHLGVSGELDELPTQVREAFGASTLFVMEADPRAVDQRQMSSMLLLPPDESLDTKLSEQAWKTLVDQLDAPPTMLRRMRPWVVESLLMEQALQRTELESPGEQMDQQLFSAARDQGKELGFLESWEAQVALMNDVMEAKDLELLIEDPGQLDQMVLGLVTAYRAHDAEALERHLFDPALVDPTHYDRIFRRRNARWVPKLRRWARRGDVFVAVGVGHLLGEHRLQAMLEARGYEVRRVAPAPVRR